MVEPLSNADKPLVSQDVMREAQRLEALESKFLKFKISDAELVQLLTEARNVVEGISPDKFKEETLVQCYDSDHGRFDMPVPSKLVLTLGELGHKIRRICEEEWKAQGETVALFNNSHLLSAESALPYLEPPEGIEVPDVEKTKKIAGKLEKDDLTELILDTGKYPDPEHLRRSMVIDTAAKEASSHVLNALSQRLTQLFNIPPVRISRAMAEWKQWEDDLEVATEQDAADVHGLYEKLLVPLERLIALDPRYATPEEFAKASQAIRDGGGMLKPLAKDTPTDEVMEGIRHGRIVIARDSPEAGVKGDLIAFYNVHTDSEVVRAHMKRELHFSDHRKYESPHDLPQFSGVEEPTGELRSIAYLDEEGARRVFEAAAKGTLVWSVDHAVSMNTEGRIQRYAQLGTAVKLDQYDQCLHSDGKTSALLKIVTILGVDASKAAVQRGMKEVPKELWMEEGKCLWTMDSTGMVIPPRPIVNVGTSILNQRLGGHEVFAVTEDFERDGVKVRALWRYFEQQLPADKPS